MQQQDLEIFAPPQGTKSQHVPFAQPDRGASALQEKLTGTKRCARAPLRTPTRAELLSIYPRQTWTWCKRRLGGRRHLFRMGESTRGISTNRSYHVPHAKPDENREKDE